jgi:hypothetical protein
MATGIISQTPIAAAWLKYDTAMDATNIRHVRVPRREE